MNDAQQAELPLLSLLFSLYFPQFGVIAGNATFQETWVETV